MNSTGAPSASPIAPPSRQPRTRLCIPSLMFNGFSFRRFDFVKAFSSVVESIPKTCSVYPGEVLARQFRLPVKAVGHQSATISGAVVHADGRLGLRYRSAGEPIVAKECWFVCSLKPRMLWNRQV